MFVWSVCLKYIEVLKLSLLELKLLFVKQHVKQKLGVSGISNSWKRNYFCLVEVRIPCPLCMFSFFTCNLICDF